MEEKMDRSPYPVPEGLGMLLSSKKRCIILLHDNPDPDALASGYALSVLITARYGLKSSILYGGLISRAENRAMVRLLEIPLKKIGHVRLDHDDFIAMIDTQPGSGNNSLPKGTRCHLVIDHHPRNRKRDSDLEMIDPVVGATATILVYWLLESGVEFSTNLATSLAYAIRTETQDLGRKTTDEDIRAFFAVYPRASMKKLSHIAYPKLPRNYFQALSDGLQKTYCYRNLISAHLGIIPYPEIVAEMADLLLRYERMSWCLCTGRFGNHLYLSLRAAAPGANAGKIIQKLVGDPARAGGHETFAGGRIPLQNGGDGDGPENRLSQQFARQFGYPNPYWKPLLADNGTSLPQPSPEESP